MPNIWTLANRQARQLKKIKNKQAKKRQESLLIATLLAGLRGAR